MKFSRWVVVVVALVLVQFAVWEWMGPDQALANPNCTMACGSPNGVCIGTNTNTCIWCSNGSSSDCDGLITNWFNNTTNGSIMGSSEISYAPLNCKRTWPCSYDSTAFGHICDQGGCNCESILVDCYFCQVGASTLYVYNQCWDDGCPES